MTNKKKLIVLIITLIITISAINIVNTIFITVPSTLKAPVNVIFDTDIGPDCDDAGSVAVLHTLEDKGEVKILGMMCCTSSKWGAPCLDSINTYYGRPDIPIGTFKKQGFLENEIKYNKYIAENWPNDMGLGTNAEDATTLYRKLLSAQPDKSVTIVAVGPLINLKNLLLSKPDVYSELNGHQLVEKKVKELSCMGGHYPGGKEWNFEQDGSAAAYTVEIWPTPITFSGWEIGSEIFTGSNLLKTSSDNPVRKAYELYVGKGKNRESWDQTAVLYAVRGLSVYWDAEETGFNDVAIDGLNVWRKIEDKPHKYLKKKMSSHKLSEVIENLMVK